MKLQAFAFNESYLDIVYLILGLRVVRKDSVIHVVPLGVYRVLVNDEWPDHYWNIPQAWGTRNLRQLHLSRYYYDYGYFPVLFAFTCKSAYQKLHVIFFFGGGRDFLK